MAEFGREAVSAALTDAGLEYRAVEIACWRRAIPWAQPAWRQVVEAVEQLRGESGVRQVQNARLALTHCQGFGGAAGVHIFAS